MDLKLVVMLALKLSIFCTVLGFGLKATLDDLLYLIRRPGLFVRSLLAVFVIMPLLAVVLSRQFDFRPPVEVALIALALSPVPPLLPKKEGKAGGHHSYGLALMAMLALLSIVVVPVSMEILERIFHVPLAVAPQVVAKVVLQAALLPLAVGMIVRALAPRFAARIEKPFELVAKILLPLAVLVLLAATLSAAGAAIGGGTVLAIVIFVVAGLVVGHVMGGPDLDHSVVLAISSASRHPAIALAILTANFPNEHFGGIIMVYLIVSAVVVIPYTVWQRKRAAGTASARSPVA
jgi:BASS family bile acid:Na+ symporter